VWIFLNDAFLSIVAHRDDPDALLVRARRQGDIERTFPGAAVSETPAADYRYRATLPRQKVADALAATVAGIDYPNFKASVADPDRHDAYLECWGILRDWRESSGGVGRRGTGGHHRAKRFP
jgi:hypothetical protein